MKFSVTIISLVLFLVSVDSVLAAKGDNSKRARNALRRGAPHSVDKFNNRLKSLYGNRPFQVTQTQITKPVRTAEANLGFKQRGVNGFYSPSTASDWYLDIEYSGPRFFDHWNFFVGPDPTRGKVNYVNDMFAYQHGLAGQTPSGSSYIRVDNWSDLAPGQFRDSVRIHSKDKLTFPSLLIMDANHLAYGITTWPAFWIIGDGWPTGGEVDIVEGTNLQKVNQMGAHTKDGCHITNPMRLSASTRGDVLTTNCNALINSNTACVIRDKRQESYGQGFANAGGGVYATVWDQNGLAIYFFSRNEIPQDIKDGAPNPSSWHPPSAFWAAGECDPQSYFAPQTVSFDITICGDWARSTWASEYGYPGTCEDQIVNKENYNPAIFDINYVQIYRGTSIDA